MYKLEYRDDPEDIKLRDEVCGRIDNPELIKKAYDLGLLVKSDTKFHGKIEKDITNEGYKVITKPPKFGDCITHTSIRPDRVYFTYQEAQDEVDARIAEFERQASLSDYDWSVEQIDKHLDFGNTCRAQQRKIKMLIVNGCLLWIM